MCAVIFKSGHALEQYLKIKFRVSQSIRWLEHISCLIFFEKLLLLNRDEAYYFIQRWNWLLKYIYIKLFFSKDFSFITKTLIKYINTWGQKKTSYIKWLKQSFVYPVFSCTWAEYCNDVIFMVELFWVFSIDIVLASLLLTLDIFNTTSSSLF